MNRDRPGRGGLRRTFRALTIPNYRLFFAGQLVSITGTWMQRVAQDWLILEVGGGPLELAVGVGLQSLPTLFLGVWGGLLVDRVRHVRVTFVLTQAAMAVLAVLLGGLVVSGHVTLAAIYATALTAGVVAVVDSPARQSFVLEMVGPDEAANAISLNSSINNAARLTGPAVAGLLIATAGTGVAYFVNAASFLAIIGALLLMRVERLSPRVPESRGRGQVLAGFRYVWGEREIRAALAATLVVSMLSQNFRVTLPVLATTVLHGGPGMYGSLMSFVGVGAVAGALICAYLASPSLRMIAVEGVAFGAALCVASLVGSYPLALVLMLALGAGNTSFNTTSNALVLLSSEPRMRGRVLSIRALVSNGATPVGSLLIGWVCEVAGVRAGLLVGGVAAVVASLFVVAVARRGPGRTPAGDAGQV